MQNCFFSLNKFLVIYFKLYRMEHFENVTWIAKIFGPSQTVFCAVSRNSFLWHLNTTRHNQNQIINMLKFFVMFFDEFLWFIFKNKS